jgi:PPK2 family polyphosphate:nucleotide phosphotransferase
MAGESAALADKYLNRIVVAPGRRVSIERDYDPALGKGRLSKQEAADLLADSRDLLAKDQERLWAQDRYALLIMFQAMDAAGKDGTIKHVMSGVNPQGCEVTSFKAPSSEELDHDYLWRCMKRLPARGTIGIFNRSYYEEVLVVRVHPEILDRQKIPDSRKDKNVWKRRFEEINNFERYLHDNGIIVLKFFLNVSKEEQKRRFIERLENPKKHWKFSASDAAERKYWADYMAAYEDCVRHTSTEWAPWHVIPADDKPFMRVLVAGIIAKTLEGLKLRFPEVSGQQKEELLRAREALEQEEL